jgi:hypothetical protein
MKILTVVSLSFLLLGCSTATQKAIRKSIENCTPGLVCGAPAPNVPDCKAEPNKPQCKHGDEPTKTGTPEK